MQKSLKAYLIIAVLVNMNSAALATSISLPDATVIANRQDSGTGSDQWWGENVTTVTIDAQNLAAGQYVQVSGKITGISNIATSWVEIGLIQKDAWDYWQTAFGGGFKSAVFDKGLYAVHWKEAAGIGFQLQEGWWEGGSTKWNKGPYSWGLTSPTSGDPWEFAISMYPGAIGGNAYFSVTGETIYGTQPLAYSGSHGYGDFGESYLIAQIWSTTKNATFSLTDVTATVIPEPGTLLLLGSGLLGFGIIAKLRRKKS